MGGAWARLGLEEARQRGGISENLDGKREKEERESG